MELPGKGELFHSSPLNKWDTRNMLALSKDKCMEPREESIGVKGIFHILFADALESTDEGGLTGQN